KPGPKRHQSLEASLRWLVHRLPEDQQADLHRLAGLPDTFSAPQAEREQRLNEEWLTRWKNLGLLEWDESGGTTRYRLRRAVRAYCHHLAPGDTSSRPAVLLALDDLNSTLADLITSWAHRD